MMLKILIRSIIRIYLPGPVHVTFFTELITTPASLRVSVWLIFLVKVDIKDVAFVVNWFRVSSATFFSFIVMITSTIVPINLLNLAITFLNLNSIMDGSTFGRESAIEVFKSFLRLLKFDEFKPASNVSWLVIVNSSSEMISWILYEY